MKNHVPFFHFVRVPASLIAMAAWIGGAAICAHAQSIVIENSGFEEPATLQDGFGTVDGWTAAGTDDASGVDLDPKNFSEQSGFLSGTNGSVFQTTQHTIQPGETYRFEFRALASTGIFPPPPAPELDVWLYYGAARTPLTGSFHTETPPFALFGTWEDYTYTIAVSAAIPPVGDLLGIEFDARGLSTVQVHIDDVAITIIPEPGSLALAAIAALSLLHLRSRARHA